LRNAGILRYDVLRYFHENRHLIRLLVLFFLLIVAPFGLRDLIVVGKFILCLCKSLFVFVK